MNLSVYCSLSEIGMLKKSISNVSTMWNYAITHLNVLTV